MDVHGDINLQFNEVQELVFQQETVFPAVPIVGRVVFKDSILYMCIAINTTIPLWLPITNKIDTYIHTQETSSTTWTVSHNLNITAPLVQVYDSGGEMLIPDSVFPNNNNEMVITFETAIAGTAIVLYGALLPAAGIGIL